jgi:hypothetical protein
MLGDEAGGSFSFLFEKPCFLPDIAKHTKECYNRISFGAFQVLKATRLLLTN